MPTDTPPDRPTEGSVTDRARAEELAAVAMSIGKRAVRLMKSVYPVGRPVGFKDTVFGRQLGTVYGYRFNDRTGEPWVLVSFTPPRQGAKPMLRGVPVKNFTA